MGGSGQPDMLQMLINISQSLDAIFGFVQLAFAFGGLLLFGIGLFDLYAYGSESGRGSSSKKISGIISKLIIGSILTCLVVVVNITQNSLIGVPAASGRLMYEASGQSQIQKDTLMAIFGLFRIAGMVAVGRGWLLLDKHFNGGNEGVGGAITHIIAGAMLVYLYEWLSFLARVTGFDISKMIYF